MDPETPESRALIMIVAWPTATPVTRPVSESTIAIAGADECQRNVSARCSRPPQLVRIMEVTTLWPTASEAAVGTMVKLSSEVQLVGPQPSARSRTLTATTREARIAAHLVRSAEGSRNLAQVMLV